MLRVVLLHPLNGPVVPQAGLVTPPQLPARHGQEEPVVAVATFAQGHRLLKGRDRAVPVLSPVMGCAKGVPVRTFIRSELDGSAPEFDRQARVAELGIRTDG